MDIEFLRSFCMALPAATEEIKWEDELCFLIGKKIFCMAGLNTPMNVSIKVTEEDYYDLIARAGIAPAPYLARYKWVMIEEPEALTPNEWMRYLKNSYELVKAKLTRKILRECGRSESSGNAGRKRSQRRKTE